MDLDEFLIFTSDVWRLSALSEPLITFYQQFVASCIKAGGGWRKLGGSCLAAWTGGCYPQECSHFYWANSWPGILAFLLLCSWLTFIYELQHFPWTIMKVAILDKMLIFLSVPPLPGLPSPGGKGGRRRPVAVTQCQCSRKTEKFIALWPGKS